MARNKRPPATFSLSFIDAMSCGLGAVILLFMIINHASEVRAVDANRDVANEVSALEAEVIERQQRVASLQASLDETRKQSQAARERAERLAAAAEEPTPEDDAGSGERIAALKQELQSLESRVEQLREQTDPGDATRARTGDGDRQYLTGMKVGGKHVLILLDASASMLDDDIVNVIRRRNMDESARRDAPKWRRARAAVDWLTTQVPPQSRFQLYTFGEQTRAALSGTDGQWLSTDGGARLTAAVRALDRVVPGGGTSLQNAAAAAAQLSPRPDNIYLITDGLPTQGREPRRGTVSGSQRLNLFRDAVAALPSGVPVNILLLPMEGDPLASSAFWQLAQARGGAFITPSVDWP